MTTKVFISKGSTTTVKQREFIDGVLESLEVSGLSPRIMYENEWSHEQPLVAIKKVIRECSGAVVIAFERTIIEKGVELKKDGKKKLQNIALTTPWNQIEAAMAYSFDLPLLVIAENGLKSEGLIEQGYDWNVYWTDLRLKKIFKASRFMKMKRYQELGSFLSYPMDLLIYHPVLQSKGKAKGFVL